MSEATTVQSTPASLRQRLQSPQNARHDDGIDLRRVPPNVKLRDVHPSSASLVFRPQRPFAPKQVIPIGAFVGSRAVAVIRRRAVFLRMAEYVAARYDVTMPNIRGPRRFPHFVIPRQIIMYIARKHLRMSFLEIARRLGGRDHTTVISGVERIEHLMASKPDFAVQVAALVPAALHAGEQA
jgi:hypothetical protein